jgi:hypothetical protein
VEVATVAESFHLLNIILDRRNPEQLLDMIDLYLRGWRAYQDHNYGQSLVNMWTVSEQLIQELWKQYIRDNRQRESDGQAVNFITGKRKERLEDERTFTAAVVSEILSLTEILPFELYRALSTARKARNDWVHDLIPVSYEVAAEAGKAAEQLLRLVEGIDLEVPPQLHLHG